MKKLTKKMLPLYAFAGFGPSFLGLLIGSYLINALDTSGFDIGVENWTYANKILVVTSVFSIMVFIAKLLDGITDVPFAAWTDSLKTKWGKRRPAIIIGFVPMVLAYVLFCFPPSSEEVSMLNTIYLGILLMVYFSAYTLTFVTYYGTYSEITASSDDRISLSNWKAFFDTIHYSIGYAVIPLIVGGGINIRIIGLAALPLMLTMLIAVFMIKEESTLPEDVAKAKEERVISSDSAPEEEDVGFMESVRLTSKNKGFMIWLGVMAAFFFGLQLFLAGQSVLASGAMGFEGWQIAVLNTSAFAPVPLTLMIYRKVMKKRGFRFAFQTALFAFSIAMLSFAIAYVEWIPSNTVRLMIGITGGTIGSYGIGAFFSAPYTIPSQMAAEELAATGKSHPSMYFAMQGLFNAVVAAFSTSLIWLNIRDLDRNGTEEFFGVHLMPYIVIGACIVSIILAFFLPPSFNQLGRAEEVQLTE